MDNLNTLIKNRALDINEIFASSSKSLMERQLVRKLERFYKINSATSEIEKRQIIYWVMRFIKFHNHQHPILLAKTDIESFLSSLATECHYTLKIQHVAEKALKYLYLEFLKVKLQPLSYISNKQRKGYLSYFGKKRCDNVINQLDGVSLLMARVMLLGNLRLSEVIRIKRSDIDIKNNRIKLFKELSKSTKRELLYTIRIPLSLVLDLRIQLMRIERLFNNTNQHISKMYSTKQDDYLFQTLNNSGNTSEKIKKEFKIDLINALNKSKSRKTKLLYSKNSKRLIELRNSINRSGAIDIDKYHAGKSFQYELEVA